MLRLHDLMVVLLSHLRRTQDGLPRLLGELALRDLQPPAPPAGSAHPVPTVLFTTALKSLCGFHTVSPKVAYV
jgi:hypothetical protein